MRLIDADATILAVVKATTYGDALRAVREQPTVDAVSVVRCKECKHRYVEEQSWGEYNEFCDFWCDGNGYWASVNADDFCSYGEVRDE